MVAAQFSVLALAGFLSLSAATPIVSRGISPLDILGGPEGLALTLLASTPEGEKLMGYTEDEARKICDESSECKTFYNEHAKAIGIAADLLLPRGISPLDILGGPEGLALTLLASTPEGEKLMGYTEDEARKICDESSECKQFYNEHAKAIGIAADLLLPRGISPLDIFGGPEGLALTLLASTPEGEKLMGYTEDEARKLCDENSDCKQFYNEHAKAIGIAADLLLP